MINPRNETVLLEWRGTRGVEGAQALGCRSIGLRCGLGKSLRSFRFPYFCSLKAALLCCSGPREVCPSGGDTRIGAFGARVYRSRFAETGHSPQQDQ